MRSLERRARLDRHLHLRDHGARVEPLVDVVDGDAGRVDAGSKRVGDRVRAGEGGQERRMDVDDALREAVEERLRQQMHVPGEDDELDAVLLEPGCEHEVALGPVGVAVERERRGRDAGLARADERVRVAPVRRDRRDRQPRVEQRLQVGAVAADEHADHAIRPITVSPGAGSATTAHQPIPRLKTRRSSSSSTCRASQSKTGRRGHASQSIDRRAPVREHALEVAEDAAAGHVHECLRAPAQRSRRRPGRGAWARAGRRRRSPRPRARDATSVKPFACRPADAKPTTASPASIVEPSIRSRRSTTPTQVPAKSSSPARVDAGQLGGLAADERDARGATDLGRAVDQLGDFFELDRVRGDVVEQHQRIRAAGGDVVDAVRGQVGAAVAQPPARAGEDELRADAVGRGGEEAALVERVQAREGAEARGARRLDGSAEALDDRAGGRQRDTRGVVAVGLASQRMEHTTGSGRGPSGHVPGTVPGTWPTG